MTSKARLKPKAKKELSAPSKLPTVVRLALSEAEIGAIKGAAYAWGLKDGKGIERGLDRGTNACLQIIGDRRRGHVEDAGDAWIFKGRHNKLARECAAIEAEISLLGASMNDLDHAAKPDLSPREEVMPK